MAMMNAGMLPEGGGGGMPVGVAGADDNDGDVDTMVTCPQCGARFAPGDTDNDAAALAAGAGAGAGMPPAGPEAGATDLATAAPPPVVEAGEGTCPECGGKMVGGKCASCGYSKAHSPMREAIDKHVGGQPEGSRPDAKKVYEQGVRTRERMRRPAPYGRG